MDPYNNPIVMPLADFIEHPLAHELVHNGQTLQVSEETDRASSNAASADDINAGDYLLLPLVMRRMLL